MSSICETFVDEALPRVRASQTALYSGDASSWSEYWSAHDAVSWLGHFGTVATGAEAVRTHCARVAARISQFEGLEVDVLVADLAGDVGYLVTHERMSMRVDGEPFDQAARVSRILRREGGRWRIAHGHADLDPLSLDLPFKPPTSSGVGK